jgi:hypothetical protein
VTHGDYVKNHDLSTCDPCHATDEKGVKYGLCISCHADFPHPDNWKDPSLHGAKVKTNGIVTCDPCHAKDENGVSYGLCAKAGCHEAYPHKAGWKNEHGTYIKEHDLSSCEACHANPANGAPYAICGECHKSFPHGADWGKPTQHGAYVIKNGLDSCKDCHEKDKNGVTYGLCYGCHGLYPHMEGWEKEGHKEKLIALKSTDSCKTACHGADLKGGDSQVACDKCHKQYPHAGGWLAKHSTTAKAITTEIPGHQFDADASLKKIVTSCNDTCHDTDNSIGGTCKQCHSKDGAIHAQGWNDPTGGQHGLFVMNNGTATCKTTCHGAGLKGGDIAKACTSCHLYPHPDEWIQATGHGVYAKTNAPSACIACHGNLAIFDDNYGPNTVPISSPKSCYNCHPAYPHIGYKYSWPPQSTDKWTVNMMPHVSVVAYNTGLMQGAYGDFDDQTRANNVQTYCFGQSGCHTSLKATTQLIPKAVCQKCHPK